MYAVEYDSVIKRVHEIMPFSATWTDLEMIRVSEVSQAEEDKYCSIYLYAESKTSDTDKVIYKREAITDIEKKLTVTTGERVGGVNKGIGSNIFPLLNIK